MDNLLPLWAVYLAYSTSLLLLLHLGGVSSGGSGWYDPGYGSSYGHDAGYGSTYGHDLQLGYGHHQGRRVTTRVTYEEPVEQQQVHVTHEVHHVLHKKKRRKQLVTFVQPGEPVAVLANGLHHHPAAGFEGSYVAVSGTPGRGSVHVVDSGRGLSITFTKPWRSNV